MKELIDSQLRAQGLDPSSWAWTGWLYAAAMIAIAGALTTFSAVFAGLTSYWERRVAARMQSRVGPNRVGPFGLLQWVADALKLIFKEDLVSASADPWMFKVAPYFLLAGTVLTFVALPFGYALSATKMNIGIYFVVSVTALSVVGVLLSGWSSNSKWALLGGMRAAAQVVSYEIPAGLALLVPVLQAGSLDFHEVIRAQGGLPWDWFVFQTPMGFVAFFVFFIALLAEGNRTPFDLSEAESELVSGYNTEYSGIRFGYFFLAEWGNLWVMGALLSALFLGGWQVPFVSVAALSAWEKVDQVPGWYYGVSLLIFCAKVIVLVNVIIWLRWTLPRVRVDQMMGVCWKWLVPGGLVVLTLTAITEYGSFAIFGEGARGQASIATARGALHLSFFGIAGAVPLLRFALKTWRNLQLADARVDLGNW